MNKKKLAAFSLVIIFAIGIPLTLFIFNRQQEIRSRASISSADIIDEFNSSTLTSGWIFSNSTNTGNYSLTSNPGHLQINAFTGTDHNCWANTTACLRMLRPFANNDGTYETKIDGSSLSSLQSYGIFFWQNSTNFLRFEIFNNRIGCWKITNGIDSQCASLTVSPGATNYLRVTKTGNSYAVKHSTNGTTWNSLFSVTVSGLIFTQAGVTVNDTASDPNLTGNFDYFHYTALPTTTITPIPTPSTVACHLQPASNRTILFNNTTLKYILSNSTFAASLIGPYTASLPAGNYKVTLESYGRHSTPGNDQDKERWYLMMGLANSTNLNTGTINDLPANLDFLTQVVNENLSIPSNVTKVTAVHSEYPDISSSNSIFPLCAAFDQITPIPTPTIRPTATTTPRPTSTPTPDGTTLVLNGLLDGIGSRGDNTNPDGTLSNKNPLHPTRNGNIYVFNASNQLVTSASGAIKYSPSNGSFAGNVSLPSPITSGKYSIKVSTDNHLVRLLPGIQSINAGEINQLPDAILVAGDVVNDNKLNILDYNILIDCYSDLAPATACNDIQKKNASDLNDDGVVNQFDYNLFLRELSTQPGQ